MKIEKVVYHFGTTMPPQSLAKDEDVMIGATITLMDGSRINGWFDAKTLTLKRAHSLPQDRDRQANYRQRNLNSAAGKQLADAFQVYSIANSSLLNSMKNYAAALETHNAAKIAAEDKRLVKVEAEQKAHRDAAMAVIADVVGINYKDAGRIVDALMEAGFISRDRSTL